MSEPKACGRCGVNFFGAYGAPNCQKCQGGLCEKCCDSGQICLASLPEMDGFETEPCKLQKNHAGKCRPEPLRWNDAGNYTQEFVMAIKMTNARCIEALKLGLTGPALGHAISTLARIERARSAATKREQWLQGVMKVTDNPQTQADTMKHLEGFQSAMETVFSNIDGES